MRSNMRAVAARDRFKEEVPVKPPDGTTVDVDWAARGNHHGKPGLKPRSSLTATGQLRRS
jgi:hypothetical protein